MLEHRVFLDIVSSMCWYDRVQRTYACGGYTDTPSNGGLGLTEQKGKPCSYYRAHIDLINYNYKNNLSPPSALQGSHYPASTAYMAFIRHTRACRLDYMNQSACHRSPNLHALSPGTVVCLPLLVEILLYSCFLTFSSERTQQHSTSLFVV